MNPIDSERLLRWQTELKGTESQLRQSVQPALWLEVLLLGMLYKSNHISQGQVINHKSHSEVEQEKTTNKHATAASHKSVPPTRAWWIWSLHGGF